MTPHHVPCPACGADLVDGFSRNPDGEPVCPRCGVRLPASVAIAARAHNVVLRELSERTIRDSTKG